MLPSRHYDVQYYYRDMFQFHALSCVMSHDHQLCHTISKPTKAWICSCPSTSSLGHPTCWVIKRKALSLKLRSRSALADLARRGQKRGHSWGKTSRHQESCNVITHVIFPATISQSSIVYQSFFFRITRSIVCQCLSKYIIRCIQGAWL